LSKKKAGANMLSRPFRVLIFTRDIYIAGTPQMRELSAHLPSKLASKFIVV